jgi:hypothetical protein
MSTPGTNLTTAVRRATKVVGSAQQVTNPEVSFNPILATVKEFNQTKPASNISKTASISALKSTVASAQETVNAATTVVSGRPTLGTETATATATASSNDNNGSTNSTPSNNANGSTNPTPSNNANGSTNSTQSNNSNGSTQSNESNENTEEPEIKSITIYNKTFLVETKVEDPLTKEQERLALHLRLPEFEGKDDEWRHSVLREVIQGCTGDFSVTVGAQCHSFRSYLEELAQKVFDEDKPIVWEGEEEERKEAEESEKKKRKILRKKEGEGDGKGDGKEDGKGDGKGEAKGEGKEDGKGDDDKEYEITISISLSDLRNLLTSMPLIGSETQNKSMTLNEAKGIADELYKVFPKDSRTKLYNIIVNNQESPFRNTPETKNTAHFKAFAKVISPTYAGSEPLSNTIEQLKVNNILLTDAQKLKLYTIFINVMNKINPRKQPYNLGSN